VPSWLMRNLPRLTAFDPLVRTINQEKGRSLNGTSRAQGPCCFALSSQSRHQTIKIHHCLRYWYVETVC
jgi:hypothetical protein